MQGDEVFVDVVVANLFFIKFPAFDRKIAVRFAVVVVVVEIFVVVFENVVVVVLWNVSGDKFIFKGVATFFEVFGVVDVVGFVVVICALDVDDDGLVFETNDVNVAESGSILFGAILIDLSLLGFCVAVVVGVYVVLVVAVVVGVYVVLVVVVIVGVYFVLVVVVIDNTDAVNGVGFICCAVTNNTGSLLLLLLLKCCLLLLR